MQGVLVIGIVIHFIGIKILIENMSAMIAKYQIHGTGGSSYCAFLCVPQSIAMYWDIIDFYQWCAVLCVTDHAPCV